MGSTDAAQSNLPLTTLSYGVGTDVGRRREENQDSYGVINTEQLKFYIVADGMGGAKGGAIASSMAVKTMEQALGNFGSLTPDDVARAISQANADIFKKGLEEEGLTGMGTTLVGLAFFDTQMIVVNVGDSRAYRIRGDKIVRMTDDHTLVNDLLRNGAITPEQAENHPVAHMLTRSLGPCPDVDVDAFIVEDGPASGDRYLLCSDGLYNVVSDQEILTIVKKRSIDDAVSELISLANERGGPDNITVIIVHVDQNYPKKVDDFTEIIYPRVSSTPVPPTDSFDIRATRDQYKSGKIKREPDDSDLRIKGFGEIQSSPVSHSQVFAQPQMAPSPLVHLKWAGLMVLGLVMGFLLSETSSYFKQRNYTEIRTVLINPLATELAPPPVVNYDYEEPSTEIGLFASERLTGVREKREFVKAFPLKPGLSKNQVESVLHRKSTVKDQLNKITSQLAILDNPNLSQLNARREKVNGEIRKLEGEQFSVGEELSKVSKSLVSWIERKQRLENVDPVDMASEVAFSSSYVRERKELFEKSTWAYLREVEVWRFSPNDKALTQKISELGKAREQRRTDLAAAVAKAVDQEKEATEEKISELSAKAKSLENRLLDLRGELEFINLVSGTDKSAKQAYRDDLVKRRDYAVTELEELEMMLP